ncbi:MAG: phosphatase PAP2 family protein [Beijerinckiaceae bacterium]
MPMEWTIILAVALSDAILLAETSFRLEASSQMRILAGLIVLAMVLVICRRWRSFPKTTLRLAQLTHTVLALILFTNAVSILSFILTGILPLPRWDEALATADQALGLNWLEMYQWLTRHPAIEASANIAYRSLGPETLILFIALEMFGHHNPARTFLLWFMISVIAALGIGALTPASGAFVYYHLPIASSTGYVAQWADLRNGTLRSIDSLANQGLVVFPSFHATLAVLCACAARPLRIVKIPLLVLNLLIILSSPAMGGHYFVDIIAGIILAALTISVHRYISSGIWQPLKKSIWLGDAPAFSSK